MFHAVPGIVRASILAALGTALLIALLLLAFADVAEGREGEVRPDDPESAGGQLAGGETFYIDYRAKPDADLAAAHQIAILSREAEIDLADLGSRGTRTLAYLSLAEVAATASDFASVKKLGIRLEIVPGKERGHPVDVRDARWADYFLKTMAEDAATRGFDGFFIDTADAVPHVAGGDAVAQSACWEAAKGILLKLKERFPEKSVVLNRGFPIVGDLAEEGAVDGVLVESLFRTYDYGAGEYLAVPEGGTEWLLEKIQAAKAAGLPVYVVDYMAPGTGEAEAREIAKKIREVGCSPLVTTVDLHGRVLAPLREISRRVLVLYGWEPEMESELGPKFPADTGAAERFQMALEWLGYEVDYFRVGKGEVPEGTVGRYAAVLFDVDLKIPFVQEADYVKWALDLKDAGAKLIFTGAIPFTRSEVKRHLIYELGMAGNADSIRGLTKAEITASSAEIMGQEVPLRAMMAGFANLQAPLDAEIGVSLSGSHEAGGEFHYDPVFVADWGGAVLDPYVQFYASSAISLLPFDPFVFLEKALGRTASSFPAPDPTTRDGLRVFYSHIDGDGFPIPSGAGRGKICGEVILERILKRYPYPVTVSVIEADTRAHQAHQLEKDRPYLEALAREIFALPQVEAASHSYSHPYIWFEGDPDYDNLYETPNLVLKPEANYPKIDLRREIEGSVNYINEELLTGGKRVEVMLWSGNCRPPAEALRICREIGVENMNGGYTVISNRQPGVAGVAPRCIPWEDEEGVELQIFASNQNEFVYTNDWRGPFYGGFSQVIETFQQTENPRRLKPANIYYHFYSAATLGAQRALERVYEWCLAQNLHALTAGQFAKIKRDCYGVRILSDGPGNYLILGGGQLRTFRVPEGAGLPDIAASEGVTGFNVHAGQTYIHTDGRSLVRLVMADAGRGEAAHLHLISSTAEIDFHRFGADFAEFTVRDVRPAEVRFGGLVPSSEYTLASGDAAPEKLQSGADGTLDLLLPPGSRSTFRHSE